jgi:hypothetical protein
MSTVLKDLVIAADLQAQLHSMDAVPTYDLEQVLVSRLRAMLVNLNSDIEQEEFLLAQLKSREPIVEIPAHIVAHLIEYLKGAL